MKDKSKKSTYSTTFGIDPKKVGVRAAKNIYKKKCDKTRSRFPPPLVELACKLK